MISCGIDFGTSNSSVAIANNGNVHLAAVENTYTTIPSALFFPSKEKAPSFGRVAVDLFFTRKSGRFMRSLKRVLGTSLMNHGTMVNGKTMRFEAIIGLFLKNLKDKADHSCGHEIENVVLGRPVHFVDNDTAADSRAEQELKKIAQAIGFKNVEFQFEPIAAAFAHERTISGEKLALVADLGGGTSDFTVIKLSSRSANKPDRSSDILANTGVRVGGNDFDKNLNLAAILPELGYKSTYGEKNLEVPLKPFHDLAEWSKVNFLYTTKIITQAQQLLHQSHDKKRFGRLLTVLEREIGHTILAAVEDAKIGLTTHDEFKTPLDFIEADFSIRTQRLQFENAIGQDVEKILSAAGECLRKAMVKNQAIDLVILTGGSTEVPLIQSELRNLFPNAGLSDSNKLLSVGLGLAYDAQRRFDSMDKP